jgi:hypothetical protein
MGGECGTQKKGATHILEDTKFGTIMMKAAVK